MNHRQNDPAFRDEWRRGREDERDRRQGREEGSYRSEQQARDYTRRRYGEEELYGERGEPRSYGSESQRDLDRGGYGRGQSGRDEYGYGGSGGSTYGAGGYGGYSGESDEERPRGRRDRDYPDDVRPYRASRHFRPAYEWEDDRDRDRDRDRGRAERGGSFFGANEPERPGEREGFFRRMFKRGPKGYQRSDERLREDICERLMYARHIDSSEVTVTVSGGKVSLEGTVPERRMKHAIEDLVDECPGIQDIDNRVRVQRAGEEAPRERESSSGAGSPGGKRTLS